MGNHGKEAHLALESQIWSFLNDPSVLTTQRLDGEDKDNQRTSQLLVITTQEQKDLKKVLSNQFLENSFCLRTNQRDVFNL